MFRANVEKREVTERAVGTTAAPTVAGLPVRVAEIPVPERDDSRVVTVFTHEQGQPATPLGFLTWSPSDAVVSFAYVVRASRRAGLGRLMWEHANSLAGPLRHGRVRTPDGDAWARSVGGELLAREGMVSVEAELIGEHFIAYLVNRAAAKAAQSNNPA